MALVVEVAVLVANFDDLQGTVNCKRKQFASLCY